jgi:putative nucleotidyltransferase with HDIG domain
MAKKRRKLDQFLSPRKKNQESVLAERTVLFQRVFRLVLLTLIMFLLAVLAAPANPAHAVGVGLLLLVLALLSGLYQSRFHPGVFDRRGSFGKFVLLVLVTIGLYRVILFMGWSPYMVPLSMFAMVAALAYSQLAAVFLTLAFGFFIGLTSNRAHGADLLHRVDFPLALVVTVGGLVAVLGMRRVRRQSKPAVVGFYVGVVQAVIICALKLLEPQSDLQSLLVPENARLFFIDPAWGFLGGLVSGGIVTCLLPAIERFFGVLTDRRLLDLYDPSNELLRVLSQQAPGTFQHTLGVMELARNAAEAIGADALLTQVGTYYHDIGKIVKPEYFVENMGEDRSVHDRLRPSMSKMIIISHVKDGIEFAKDAGLPQKVIDMIPMHHGTTLVEYFYQKARRESGASEDAPGEVEYRYPGPKPRFREAGILMLADVVEAIAKTEAEPNPSRFRAMVHDQILKRLLDGQLDESDLTLNDLRLIEESFVRTLTSVYHSRIKYPRGPEPPDLSSAPPPPPQKPAGAKQDTASFRVLADGAAAARRSEGGFGPSG